MSKLQTITNPEWLDNAHAGEMLVTEFMEPVGLAADALAYALGVSPARLESVIEGARPIDADLDLRLSRYFCMSEGFFLRLQNRHDIIAAKRALNGSLERIIPRAA